VSGIDLHLGDALAVLRDLPTGSVDALITDPPYSSGGMLRGDRTMSTVAKYVQSDSASRFMADFSGDTRDQRAYGYWLALWLTECLRIVKPGGGGPPLHRLAAAALHHRRLPGRRLGLAGHRALV